MYYDIRRLDVYRKIPKDLTEPTYTGAIISIMSCVFMSVLFVSELVSFLTVEIISEMYVSDESDGRIPVHIDVLLPRMQCQYLGLDLQDSLGRHELGAVENVIRLPVNNSEGCHFTAHFKIKRVPGNFHISTHSSREQPMIPDMSHDINSVTFGDSDVHNLKLPGSFSPLSGLSESNSNASVAAHEYFLKVVPTVVDEVGGKGPLYACQYTYAKRVYVLPGPGKLHPAVWFHYDLSPITVKYTEKRKPLYSFVTTVCAIVGGTFTVTGIIDSVVFTASRVFKKAEIGKLS